MDHRHGKTYRPEAFKKAVQAIAWQILSTGHCPIWLSRLLQASYIVPMCIAAQNTQAIMDQGSYRLATLLTLLK